MKMPKKSLLAAALALAGSAHAASVVEMYGTVFPFFDSAETKNASAAPPAAERPTQLSAGAYAPIRVLLREDGEGSAFEYDRPASVFGQFGDPQVDAVAQRLDQDLQAVLEAAAS